MRFAYAQRSWFVTKLVNRIWKGCTRMKVFRNLGCFTLFTSLTAAQCPVTTLISGLQAPLGITQSNQGNLLVSDSGGISPNTGQISLIDLSGSRRTLIAGLPSGINDVGMPSGPAG